ncbi:MAG: hypothetical protein H7Z12_19510 [Rhodospirillaceae bacterium]|nr:hypothetical protein [Rhodospirillales bacterium]
MDKAVEKLQSQAHATSGGNCGSYIKSALKAGGLVVGTGIGSAKDMGPALKDAGFTAVDQTSYTPRKGDVVVIQPYLGGNENGHIAMYDGTKWISAFNQRDMWSGPGYRENKPPSQIYRRGS